MNIREKKKICRCSICVVIFIMIMALFFFGMHCWERRQDAAVTESGYQLTYKGRHYSMKSDIETFLVIGLDKFSDGVSDGEGGGVQGACKGDAMSRDFNNRQSDFLMLAVADNSEKSYRMLHINRDTMADIDILGKNSVKTGERTEQLALAHTYGSGEKDSCCYTRRTVSDLLENMRIDHYASFTLDAVPEMNDILGGVEVTVLDDFTGADPEMKEGRTMVLDGQQALMYVRARGELDDSTNLKRMERQRQYVAAADAKFHAMLSADSGFAESTVTDIFPYITSDLTAGQVSRMIEKIGDYSFNGFSEIDGEMVRGEKYMEFYPDEDSIMKNVIELFYNPADRSAV